MASEFLRLSPELGVWRSGTAVPSHTEPGAWVPTFLKQTPHKETSGEESSHHHGLLTVAEGMGVFTVLRPWGINVELWGKTADGVKNLTLFLRQETWADHLLSPASVWLWNKWESCLFSPTGFIKQSKHCHKNKRCCAWESGKGDGSFPKESTVVLKLLLAKIDRKKMKIILLKFLLLNMKPSDWKLWWWYLLNRKVLSIKNEPPTRDRRNERALQRTFRSVALSLMWALHGQMWSEVHCISQKLRDRKQCKQLQMQFIHHSKHTPAEDRDGCGERAWGTGNFTVALKVFLFILSFK